MSVLAKVLADLQTRTAMFLDLKSSVAGIYHRRNEAVIHLHSTIKMEVCGKLAH